MKNFKKTLAISFLGLWLSASAQTGRVIGDGELFGHPSLQRLSPEFGILVWNIAKKSSPAIAKGLKEIGAQSEIILLQETLSTENHKKMYLNHGRSFEFLLAKSFYSNGDGGFTGVTNGAVAAAQEWTAWRSTATEPIARTPKTAVVQKIPWQDGVTLNVVNVHAINFVTDGTYENFWRELGVVLSTLEGPAIVAGDMNTWSHSRMEILENTLGPMGFERLHFPGDDRELSLDHVFIRGVRVSGQERLENYSGSDHVPLYFRVSLQ